jgi:hypothetical protein
MEEVTTFFSITMALELKLVVIALRVKTSLIVPNIRIRFQIGPCGKLLDRAKEMNAVSTKVLLQFFLQSAHFFPVHIFSSDIQACFALITTHNTPSNMLPTPLYLYHVQNVYNMDPKHA